MFGARPLVLAAITLGSVASLAGCGDGGDDDIEEESVGPAPSSSSGGAGAGGSSGRTAGTGGAKPLGNGGSAGRTMTAPEPPACDGIPAEVLAEVLPNPGASLAGVGFDGDIAGFVDEALVRRYPFGLELVEGGRRETAFGDCSVVFAEPADSAQEVYAAMEVIVHECGHLHDLAQSTGSRSFYALHSELSYECARGDSTARGGDTFARSRLVTDEYQDLRPPCSTGGSGGCDPYANVYLDGNPDDAVFQGGDQGYNLLVEEAVQYVNSIATARAFADQQPRNILISSRDGILTFLWYIERYLRLARTQFPGAYARITGDECWRDLTLGVWARAWRYLDLTEDQPALGIEDDAILELVEDPELLEEIERLRQLACP